MLDVTATVDADGKRMAVSVVNRHKDQPLTATIDFCGAGVKPGAPAYELNATDIKAGNNFETPEAVQPRKFAYDEGGPCLAYTFPAHSLTFFEFELVHYGPQAERVQVDPLELAR